MALQELEVLIVDDLRQAVSPDEFENRQIACEPAAHANDICGMLPVEHSWFRIEQDFAKTGDNEIAPPVVKEDQAGVLIVCNLPQCGAVESAGAAG